MTARRGGRGEQGRRHLLAIDTATREGVVALGDVRGVAIAVDRWPADRFHGEHLLASVRRVLEEAGSSLGELAGIVVGIGPGSFTGLRVGLAGAKGLAFGLAIPIVGIESPVALAAADAADAALAAAHDSLAAPAAEATVVVLQPAGPGGLYRSVVKVGGVVEPASARLESVPVFHPADAAPVETEGTRLLAVDLPAAPAEWQAAGERAREGLGAALLRLGATRRARARPADLAELVPVYVTLPRGVAAPAGPMAWSRDPR